MDKEKEHYFDHLPTKSDIENALFLNDPEKDPNDPRCINFKRVHTIPKINWIDSINFVIFVFLLIIGTGLILHDLFSNIYISIFVPLVWILIMGLIFIKPISIFVVELYQRFAPKKVRDKCRFYPSCSDYMKLAIKKYGFWKGFIKGCKRIKKCKYPNGGFDYP